MTEICGNKVKNLGLKAFIQKKGQNLNTTPLIEFIPKKSEKSEILNDLKISNIIKHFPPFIRAKDWELVFSLNRDGVSVGTFFERCKHWTMTLLVV